MFKPAKEILLGWSSLMILRDDIALVSSHLLYLLYLVPEASDIEPCSLHECF